MSKAPVGVYVMWTKPKIDRKKSIFEDYELLILSLSSLLYRKFNNQTKMYTDQAGAAYLERCNLSWVWNEIDTKIVHNCHQDFLINSKYENAGKMKVMANIELPYLYIDNDAIVAEKINDSFFEYDLVCAHDEFFSDPKQFYCTGYPPPFMYETPSGFAFDERFNWNKSIIMNTALVYMNNKDFQKEFKNNYEKYLNNNPGRENFSEQVAQYLYLDQRLFGLILNRDKSIYSYTSFLEKGMDLTNTEMKKTPYRKENYSLSKFHHLWSAKKTLRLSKNARIDYISQLLDAYLHLLPTDQKRQLFSLECFSAYKELVK